MTRIRPRDKPTPSPIARASDFFGPGVGEGLEVDFGVVEGLRPSADTPAVPISKILDADPLREPMEIWLFWRS